MLPQRLETDPDILKCPLCGKVVIVGATHNCKAAGVPGAPLGPKSTKILEAIDGIGKMQDAQIHALGRLELQISVLVDAMEDLVNAKDKRLYALEKVAHAPVAYPLDALEKHLTKVEQRLEFLIDELVVD